MAARNQPKRHRPRAVQKPLQEDHTSEVDLDQKYLTWQKMYLFPLFKDLRLQTDKDKQRLSPDTNWPLASMALTQFILCAESVTKVDWVSLGEHWEFHLSNKPYPEVSKEIFIHAQLTMISLCAEAESFARLFLDNFTRFSPTWLTTPGWNRALNVFLTAFPIFIAQQNGNTPPTSWEECFQKIDKTKDKPVLFQLFEKIVLYPGIQLTLDESRSFCFLKKIYNRFYPVDPIVQLRDLLGWGVISFVIYPFTESDVPQPIRSNPNSRISDIIAEFGGKSLMLSKATNVPRLIYCNPKHLKHNGKYYLLLEKKTYKFLRNTKNRPFLCRALTHPSLENRQGKLKFKAPIDCESPHAGYIQFELDAPPFPASPNESDSDSDNSTSNSDSDNSNSDSDNSNSDSDNSTSDSDNLTSDSCNSTSDSDNLTSDSNNLQGNTPLDDLLCSGGSPSPPSLSSLPDDPRVQQPPDCTTQ